MRYFERNKSYKYELAEQFDYDAGIAVVVVSRYVYLNASGIQIYRGYAWDGSSIPFKKLLGKITFGKYDADRYCKEASLVHDAFYQLMRLKLLSRDHKDAIDRLYEKMCIAGATKIIMAQWGVDRREILDLDLPWKKLNKKLASLSKKNNTKLARLPAWAAHRYWAVKHFGTRTLSPRYYPEKQILET